MQVTEKFVEFASEGSLAIEVWGNRMKGFDSNSKVNWNWNVEPQQKGLHDRYSTLALSLLTMPSPKLINFAKLQTEIGIPHRINVPLNSFSMNGHTLGFCP